VLEVRYDFTRFMAYLRRSVTVIAEGVPQQQQSNSAKQKRPQRFSIAVPGYIEATSGGSNNSNDGDEAAADGKGKKSITWIGRLDMAKHGAKIFGAAATAGAKLSTSSIRLRLVLGGSLMHSKGKPTDEAPRFTLMTPLFLPQEPTKTVARIAAVAMPHQGKDSALSASTARAAGSSSDDQQFRVEVTSAFAVEKFVPDGDRTGKHSFKNVATLQIAFLPKQVIPSSRGGGGSATVDATSIEIRAEDPEALYGAEEVGNVDIVLELKIIPADSVDEQLARWMQRNLPAWMVSPTFFMTIFALLFIIMAGIAMYLSLRGDNKLGSAVEDF
jgi:hypothetical protein